MTTSPPLSQDEALTLYQGLLDGDATAPSELVSIYLPYLANHLLRVTPRVEESQCYDAAEDALLSLIKNPGSYQPQRSTLDAYLRMAASADLRNIQRAEHRHRAHRADWGAVEHSPEMGKYLHDDDADPARIVEIGETIMERQRQQRSAGLVDGLTPAELAVLQLMRIKERKTERYAEVLGITHLPFAQQRREVKRVKDRLTKRIQRAEAVHG